MAEEVNVLAGLLVKKLEQRLLVGICGIPASGKSTFAEKLTNCTNAILAESAQEYIPTGYEKTPAQAILVGLDGWHLTRAQLDLLPDPKLARDRRGIHWSFDGPSYVEFVRSLRIELTPNTPVITAPSFDHALKDPTPHAVSIHSYHRIVIIEGLYTLLSIAPWNEGGILLDERWYIQVGIEDAQRRLVRRHVASGVAKDHEEAVWRAEENDMPNGRFVIANMLEPTRVIESRDDPLLSAST